MTALKFRTVYESERFVPIKKCIKSNKGPSTRYLTTIGEKTCVDFYQYERLVDAMKCSSKRRVNGHTTIGFLKLETLLKIKVVHSMRNGIVTRFQIDLSHARQNAFKVFYDTQNSQYFGTYSQDATSLLFSTPFVSFVYWVLHKVVDENYMRFSYKIQSQLQKLSLARITFTGRWKHC